MRVQYAYAEICRMTLLRPGIRPDAAARVAEVGAAAFAAGLPPDPNRDAAMRTVWVGPPVDGDLYLAWMAGWEVGQRVAAGEKPGPPPTRAQQRALALVATLPYRYDPAAGSAWYVLHLPGTTPIIRRETMAVLLDRHWVRCGDHRMLASTDAGRLLLPLHLREAAQA